MKITERQLIVLLQTTVESLKIPDRMEVFGFDEKTRKTVWETIINQQTATLEVSQEPPK